MFKVRNRNISERRFFYTPKTCLYRQLLKQIMNRSYSLNSMCLKFSSNKRVFRIIAVRKIEVSLYLDLTKNFCLKLGQTNNVSNNNTFKTNGIFHKGTYNEIKMIHCAYLGVTGSNSASLRCGP